MLIHILVNTARGAICNAEDVAAAVKSGQLNGYAGDVWNVQPAPKEHPWRYMKNPLNGGNGMVPHYSGTTLDAQLRYATGTKQILENFFNDKPQELANIIVAKSEYMLLSVLRTRELIGLCRGIRHHVLRPAVKRRILMNCSVHSNPICIVYNIHCTILIAVMHAYSIDVLPDGLSNLERYLSTFFISYGTYGDTGPSRQRVRPGEA